MAAARAVTLTVGIGPLETVSEGVLDSRNVRVSIPAPGGPSAFSVWRGVGNVVDQPDHSTLRRPSSDLGFMIWDMRAWQP